APTGWPCSSAGGSSSRERTPSCSGVRRVTAPCWRSRRRHDQGIDSAMALGGRTGFARAAVSTRPVRRRRIRTRGRGMNERATLREIWRETRGLVRPVRARYLGAAAAVIVSTLITLAGPALVRYAVDEGISKHRRGPLDTAAIVLLCLAAGSLVALPHLLLSSWAFHHSAGGVYHAIRDRVADTLTALQEGLAGVRVVQAFRRERRTLEAYNPRSRAQVHAWRRASFVNI